MLYIVGLIASIPIILLIVLSIIYGFYRGFLIFTMIAAWAFLGFIAVVCFGFVKYRLTYGPPVMFEREIRYQMVDIGQGDYFRYYLCESIFGNKRIFVQENKDKVGWFYIFKKDWEKAWPESPFDMKKKGYTIEAEFETKRLLMGGWSPAKIKGIFKVEHPPLISK